MLTLTALALLAGCGARTPLEADGDAAVAPSCAQPWLLFDFADGRSAYRIAAVHPDGTGFRLLSLGAEFSYAPNVSPDGRTLLFVVSSGMDEVSLRARDLLSGQTRTLARASTAGLSSGITRAALSPDNRYVAFGQSSSLHLANADGTSDRVALRGPFNAGCCQWGYGHPVFSADSATVFGATIGRLESLRVDGSNHRVLWSDRFFSNRSIPGFVFPNPALSPDGRRLVAQVACDTSQLRLYDASLAPADPCATGTRLVDVGPSMASNESANPSWGPGDLLAWSQDKDLFVLPVAGGTPVNVTSALTTAQGSFAAEPVWAPACANLP